MNFLSRFTVLRGAVRELWIVFAAKLLTILAYAIMNSTLVLWLSSDLGYNDTNAGYLVALWSSVMTMCVVMVGSLTDAIGLRRTFLIGLWMAIGARILMTVTTNHFVALGLGLFPLAFGEAMLTPVMVAADQALRHHSTAVHLVLDVLRHDECRVLHLRLHHRCGAQIHG